MRFSEWYYLLVAALVNVGLVWAWHKWIAQKKISGKETWAVVVLGSLLSAWGIDVVHRLAEAETLFHMLQVVLGLWIFIAASTSAKHYAINNWSKRIFWLNYGCDLIGFILMGLVIFALT